MHQLRILSLAILSFLLFGCKTTLPQRDFSKEAKIGIVSLIKNEVTHYRITGRITTRYTPYDIGWNHSHELKHALARKLSAECCYRIVLLDPTPQLNKYQANTTDNEWHNKRILPELARMGDEFDLDAIIVLDAFNAFGTGGLLVHRGSSGYGLYSHKSGDDQIAVSLLSMGVFALNPVQYLGASTPIEDRTYLEHRIPLELGNVVSERDLVQLVPIIRRMSSQILQFDPDRFFGSDQ